MFNIHTIYKHFIFIVKCIINEIGTFNNNKDLLDN